MKKNIFYAFSSKSIPKAFTVNPVGLKQKKSQGNNPKIIYAEDQLIVGEFEGITFPVGFKQVYGTDLKDLIETGWPSLFLISERIKTELKKKAITGWETFPIKLMNKKKKIVEGYYGLAISGRSGPLKFKKSSIFEKRLVIGGPKVSFYRGLEISAKSWDKSDFFIPGDSSWIIVTKKVVDIINTAKFTNIEFERLETYELNSLNAKYMKGT